MRPEQQFSKVMLKGNVSQDSKSNTVGEQTVTRFGVAVSHSVKNRQTGNWEDLPMYFSVEVWEKNPRQTFTAYKGDPIMVIGEMKPYIYNDKQGVAHQIFQVAAEQVAKGVRPVPAQGYRQPQGQQSSPALQQARQNVQQAFAPTQQQTSLDQFQDDDIPF